MTEHDRSPWTSTDRDRRSQTSVVVWSLIWVVAFLIVDFVIGRDWVEGSVAVALAFTLPRIFETTIEEIFEPE